MKKYLGWRRRGGENRGKNLGWHDLKKWEDTWSRNNQGNIIFFPKGRIQIYFAPNSDFLYLTQCRQRAQHCFVCPPELTPILKKWGNNHFSERGVGALRGGKPPCQKMATKIKVFNFRSCVWRKKRSFSILVWLSTSPVARGGGDRVGFALIKFRSQGGRGQGWFGSHQVP